MRREGEGKEGRVGAGKRRRKMGMGVVEQRSEGVIKE